MNRPTEKTYVETAQDTLTDLMEERRAGRGRNVHIIDDALQTAYDALETVVLTPIDVNAYALPLTETSPQLGRQRFIVYLETPNGLKAVWPNITADGTDVLPVGMIHSKHAAYSTERFPAFHFCLSGWGFNKLKDIGLALADYYGVAIKMHRLGVNGDPDYDNTSLTNGVQTLAQFKRFTAIYARL